MTAAGTDAIGALRWGLRRYGLLFLTCLVLGGVLAPAVALRSQAPLEAEALVIAQRLDMDLVALPRFGEAVFGNGAVAQAVAADFGDLGDFDDIVPDRAYLEATQDSIVFRVIGRDRDPEVAAGIANTAADAFLQALNNAGVGVGTFALQSPAEPPADDGQRLNPVVAVAAGIAAGLFIGLALVSLLVIVRRPVITPADAEEATGVTSLGTVRVPRARRGTVPPAQHFAGLIPVCRRLLALSLPTVLLLSRRRRREGRARADISVALAEVLMRVRRVHYVGEATTPVTERLGDAVTEPVRGPVELSSDGDPHPSLDGRPALTVVDGSEPMALLQPPETTVSVLIVPQGIGSAALRAAVVEHLGGSAEPRILLAKPGPWWRGESGGAETRESRATRHRLAVGDRA
jgi:hypothetical protein